MADDRRAWAVVDVEGRRVAFLTETAARTRAALDRGRGLAVVVEHRNADGWHECPGAECIPPGGPDSPGSLGRKGRARLALYKDRTDPARHPNGRARRPPLPG
jgi:hypothetical protein